MKSNDQLASLVSLEKAHRRPRRLLMSGATVVVDGSTAQLTGGTANWSLNVTKPSTATITIKDSTPAPLRSTPARRITPGTVTAMTAASGPTAPIRSPPPR